MFKIFFCCHSKIIEFLHAHFILTMSSSSPVARLSVTQRRCCMERGQNWSLVLFLFISLCTLILNISVSLSHFVPAHVLDNCPTPFKIVLTYTSTSRVNAFGRLLVKIRDAFGFSSVTVVNFLFRAYFLGFLFASFFAPGLKIKKKYHA